MSIFASRSGLALVLALLCLGGQTAHAQGPLSYWTPGWPVGLGGNMSAGQGSNTQGLNTYGNFPGFDGSDARNGFSSTRYNFSNGFFVGSERSMGFGMNGLSQNAAFGSFTTQGMQFGYNFQNSPVTLFGGVDTLKYNAGFGAPTTPFAATSGTAGYSAHAGVEFKPASNLSLSLSAGYTQTSGRPDSDASLPSLSGASQFDLVGGRR
jgi:hypothetical protein